MRESNSVRLKITSVALSAQDIEARLGLKPDESWKIGERMGAFGSVSKEHGYALDSTASHAASVSDHARSLIKRVADVVQKIAEVSTQAKVEIVCVIRAKTPPSLAFDRDDLRWFAAMGARLDIDLHLIADRDQKLT
ncbi:MAG: DUF4279 domain-containing protein [Elusimicrobia bacterium]|nr:DUF4279 domain-containing protein [Elusimicrobiota bacterium]